MKKTLGNPRGFLCIILRHRGDENSDGDAHEAGQRDADALCVFLD